jgi:hypothetical protein
MGTLRLFTAHHGAEVIIPAQTTTARWTNHSAQT